MTVGRICHDHRPADQRRIMVQIAARASPARVLASDRSRYETAAKAERPPQVGSGGYTPVRGRERDKAGAVSAGTTAGVASSCRVWPPKGSALHRAGRARRARPADSTSLV